MQRYDSSFNTAAQSSQQSSRQQQQQQLEQDERNRQQYQQMAMNQANSYYSMSDQSMANLQGLLQAGQEHQTSPAAFRWPPVQQQQQLQQRDSSGEESYPDLSFSSNSYYDNNTADAEINAILSNYQPKMYPPMQNMSSAMQGSTSNMGPSPQPMLNDYQQGSRGGNSSQGDDNSNSGMSGLMSNHLDSTTAAAAAAAYGHLGYNSGMSSSLDQSGMSSVRNEYEGYSDATSSISNAGLDFQRPQSTLRGSNRGNGYDGDASNTSSAQTPGALSSGDDSSTGKRRRTTMGGGPASINQQERYEAGMSTGGADGRGATAAQARTGRPVMLHHGTSFVDSKSLEKMAQESLHRASQDNSRATSSNLKAHPNRAHPARPAFHQKKSSGSMLPHQSSSTSTVTTQSIDSQNKITPKSYSGSNYLPPTSSNSQPSPVSQRGHAASHPPGLGGQTLRGADPSANGLSAATDFTKRKGWPTRIVEELLDFVHVLDRQGRVLFASPSILTLTGWRAEELRGRELTDFVHPDDVAAVRREFQTSLHDRSELTMYYRFQRKPKTAADKQRVREQREALHVSRSRSGSTSGGDSSSNQDNVSSHNKMSTFAGGSMDNQFGAARKGDVEDEGDLEDDIRDKYVIFEATGHPYISPEGSFPESDWKEEHIEKILPEVVALVTGVKGEQGDTTPNQARGKRAEDIQCFFCSCRIYPTKNVGMLDSFLELKLENERLRLLLSELSFSDNPQGVLEAGGMDGGSDGRRSLDEGQVGYPLDYPLDNDLNARNRMGQGTGLSDRFGMADVPATRIRKDSVISSGSGGNSNPVSPSIGQALDDAGTMRVASGQSAVDESDDEKSPNTASASVDEKKKKKKPKQEEGDYVCTDCGRVDSPEWRKGPLGPKTLCNACGLRWAKKIKRNGGDPNAISMAARPAKGQIKAQAAAARAQKQNQQYQNENGDATQSGPPPLNPGSVPMHSFTSQQQHSSPTDFLSEESFSNLYGDATWAQIGNHDSLSYDQMMPQQQQQQQQHMGHVDYSQSGGA